MILSPSDLVKRLEHNRRCSVSIGGKKVICRRPTDREASDLYRNIVAEKGSVNQAALDEHAANIYLNFVVDWEGFTENDVIDNGNSDPVPFDLALWRAWVVDHREWWIPTMSRVDEAYFEHQKAMEDAAKKS